MLRPNLYPFPIKGNHSPEFSHRSPGGFFFVYFNHTVFQISWDLLLKLKIFYFAGVELGVVERLDPLDKRND